MEYVEYFFWIIVLYHVARVIGYVLTKAPHQSTRRRITITHMAIKAVGVAMKATPSLNGYICFDKFVPHTTVDISCLVALEGGGQLANSKICNADKKSCVEIADDLKASADRLRGGRDEDFKKSLDAMKLLPTFLLRPLVAFTGFLASSLGLNIPALGVRPFPFGSALVTSVGMLGLDNASVPF